MSELPDYNPDTSAMKLRVWWIPQVPMIPFYVAVDSVPEAAKVMQILAEYDDFQYKQNIKPDYSNAGGLEMWDDDADGEGNPGYVDWYDEETGEDDPIQFCGTEWVER